MSNKRTTTTRSRLDGSETKPDIRMAGCVPPMDGADTPTEREPEGRAPALDQTGTKGEGLMGAAASSRRAAQRGRTKRAI